MKRIFKDINFIPLNWGTGKDLVIILDTNILIYMLKSETKTQIEQILTKYQEVIKIAKERKLEADKKIKDLNIIHAISSVSIFECLQRENQLEYINLFKTLKCYEIDMDAQYIAAQLKTFYAKRGISKDNLPDLYISATALLNSSAILTANQSDYPSILFKEVSAHQITWKENERTRSITLYLLRPDYIKARDNKFMTVIEG